MVHMLGWIPKAQKFPAIKIIYIYMYVCINIYKSS